MSSTDSTHEEVGSYRTDSPGKDLKSFLKSLPPMMVNPSPLSEMNVGQAIMLALGLLSTWKATR